MNGRIPWNRINWTNTVFLIGSPLIVAVGVPLHLIQVGFDVALFSTFVFACWLTSLSITAGYHRHFSHKSYEASQWVRFLYLIFGAAALQGSALKWSTDHRRHHRHVDSEKDPYSIQRGFWYAHIGWVFLRENVGHDGSFAPDLEKDRLVRWQHRYYLLIAVVVGFGLPTLIGGFFGSAWGGLLWGGFARVVVTHHCTFFINSLCHYWGSQPYGDRTSARDNFVMAFLTYGEGYHNFHHRFQADYRNGIRWYQWDPTKWLIWMGSVLGFTSDLKRVDELEILKARVTADEKWLLLKGFSHERIAALRERILSTKARMREIQQRTRELRGEFSSAYDQRIEDFYAKRQAQMEALRTELRLAELEFRAALQQWRYLRTAAPAGAV